jgi:RNA polymerase sigma-70 factor (ECF subfamily)
VTADPLTRLILRLQDGDRAAFAPAYEAVAPKIDAVCARLLGAGPDAEDAAQQALMNLFERVGAYDPDRGPALPWVVGIAAWEARTVRRRRWRRREDALADAPIPEGPAEEPAWSDDRWDELDAVLATLQPIDREVVLAALGRGPSPIVAPAALRKRLSRAVQRIRSLLGRAA